MQVDALRVILIDCSRNRLLTIINRSCVDKLIRNRATLLKDRMLQPRQVKYLLQHETNQGFQSHLWLSIQSLSNVKCDSYRVTKSLHVGANET